MNSKAMIATGAVMLAVGIFATGVAVVGAAEAANPATVTINYLSAGPCGTVSGTKNARVVSSTLSQTSRDVRACVATFRVAR